MARTLKAMRRPLLILLGALAAAAAVFLGGYFMADRLCTLHAARSTDDLEWLQLEFHLNNAEMARIRKLHEGYLPVCRDYCARIAEKKHQLKQLLGDGQTITPAAEQTFAQIAALRAQCQTAMLQHFAEVSRAMPPREGRRYLAEMQRLTLGFHERIEAVMSSQKSAAHGHH